MTGTLRWVVIIAVAVGLTVVFWSPLWIGGGFVGGDVYSYFLPQKAFYAEHLKAGEFPLWNNRTGFGYPLVAESQTGAFYPINLILYPTLELNTAYNASFILHYILAFTFTALYSRRLGLGLLASILAATVYVYGWFPARCSLEWAIVGGTWMPLALWCGECFLQTRRWKYLAGLSFTLAVQLLAGHFCLAFITQLTLVGYIGLRLMWNRCVNDKTDTGNRGITALLLGGAVVLGFLLAAIQLLPTWELKQQSQRLSVTEEHDPGYGHIPPIYLSQVVASWWFWYSPDVDVDRALPDMKFLALSSRTNKTEAHLYFGLLPLVLVIIGFFRQAAGTRLPVERSRSRETSVVSVSPKSHDFGCAKFHSVARLGGRSDPGLRKVFWIWCVLGLASAVCATGLFLPVTRHLPGFSFFEGLGRYGVATTFAMAVMSAIVFDQWSRSKKSVALTGIIGLSIVSLTIWDLRVVGRQMAVSVMVPSPPIERLDDSPLRKMMNDSRQPQRMFAPGPNLPNLLGQSGVPVYLGLGPAEYFDPEYRFPESADASDSAMGPEFSDQQRDWLVKSAVTHVVSFEHRPATVWLSESQAMIDLFLNQAWGRRPNSPIYVQSVKEFAGRVSTNSIESVANITRYSANSVEIEVDAVGEETQVFLRDLFFPGWTVTVDDQSVVPFSIERLIVSNGSATMPHSMPEEMVSTVPFRGVNVPPGKHRVVWKYQPRSIYWGAIVSSVALVILLSCLTTGRRRRQIQV